VTELSRYEFTPLRGGDFLLYRGSCSGLASVLLVVAKDASREQLKRLEHEYALKAELDAGRPVCSIASIHPTSKEFFDTLSSRIATSRSSALVKNLG
jgi:hypothetical protein